MRLRFGFDVCPESNQRYGVRLFVVDGAGYQLGRSVPVIDPVYAHAHQAVDALVSALRALSRERVPGLRHDELHLKDYGA